MTNVECALYLYMNSYVCFCPIEKRYHWILRPVLARKCMNNRDVAL